MNPKLNQIWEAETKTKYELLYISVLDKKLNLLPSQC